MTDLDLLTMGECMAALRASQPIELLGELTLSCAGAESNVAIGLARLGHAAGLIGCVGDDGYGRAVRRTLMAEGVHLMLEVGDGPTGLVTFVRHGTHVEVEYRRAGSAGAGLTRAHVDDALAGRSARRCHLTGITPALGPGPADAWQHLLDRMTAVGVPVSLDVNHRSKLSTAEQARAVLAPVAARCDTVLGDDRELGLLCAPGCSNPAADLLDRGVQVVIVKQGGNGVDVVTRTGRQRVPAVPAVVADVIGAGDAFCAGFLSARIEGLDPVRAARRGARVAAFAVSGAGDWEHLPGRGQLLAAGEVQR